MGKKLLAVLLFSAVMLGAAWPCFAADPCPGPAPCVQQADPCRDLGVACVAQADPCRELSVFCIAPALPGPQASLTADPCRDLGVACETALPPGWATGRAWGKTGSKKKKKKANPSATTTTKTSAPAKAKGKKKHRNPSFNPKGAMRAGLYGLVGVASGLVEVGLDKYAPPALNNPYDLALRSLADAGLHGGAGLLLGGMGQVGPGAATISAGLSHATRNMVNELAVPADQKDARKAAAEKWLADAKAAASSANTGGGTTPPKTGNPGAPRQGNPCDCGRPVSFKAANPSMGGSKTMAAPACMVL